MRKAKVGFLTPTGIMICTLVDSFTVFDRNKLLVVPLRLSVAKDSREDPKLVRFLYILVHKPANYIGVGRIVSEKVIGYELGVEVTEADLCSRHDSCWRSDGVGDILSESFFEMCHEAFPDVVPADLYTLAELVAIDPIRVMDVGEVTDDQERRKLVFSI